MPPPRPPPAALTAPALPANPPPRPRRPRPIGWGRVCLGCAPPIRGACECLRRSVCVGSDCYVLLARDAAAQLAAPVLHGIVLWPWELTRGNLIVTMRLGRATCRAHVPGPRHTRGHRHRTCVRSPPRPPHEYLGRSGARVAHAAPVGRE
eukprot:4162265-Prymnesium_polylepis.1